MGVGLGWGVWVMVGGGSVGVLLGVGVTVSVEVGVISMMASGVVFSAKYTMTAPIARKRANKPMAAGKLRVMAGMRLPWTALAGWTGFSALPRSAPHTRQRVASSVRRVPHVGQSFVEEGDVDSGLIVV